MTEVLFAFRRFVGCWDVRCCLFVASNIVVWTRDYNLDFHYLFIMHHVVNVTA